MQERQPSLIRRDDTFLGVCQALGEDFGFHPNLLRVAFALPLIFAPILVLQVYFAAGAVVLLSRILAPRPRRKAAVHAEAEAQPAAVTPQVPLSENDADQYALPMAA